MVNLVKDFLMMPLVHRCPLCAEIEGNPGGVEVPMGPTPALLPEEEDEYQDIHDTLESLAQARDCLL